MFENKKRRISTNVYEEYSVYFLKNEAANEKILYRVFYLFLNVEYSSI